MTSARQEPLESSSSTSSNNHHKRPRWSRIDHGASSCPEGADNAALPAHQHHPSHTAAAADSWITTTPIFVEWWKQSPSRDVSAPGNNNNNSSTATICFVCHTTLIPTELPMNQSSRSSSTTVSSGSPTKHKTLLAYFTAITTQKHPAVSSSMGTSEVNYSTTTSRSTTTFQSDNHPSNNDAGCTFCHRKDTCERCRHWCTYCALPFCTFCSTVSPREGVPVCLECAATIIVEPQHSEDDDAMEVE
jgi:hypothetical protein